jgi:hypothetical protein
MQDVRDSMTSGERGPVSPIKAFLVLGAVVAATIGMIIATRPDPPAATQQPNSASIPTEAEAIEIFNELHELWLRSYRERDASLIKLFAAPDAPTLGSAEEIRQLRRDGVLYRSQWDRQALTVISATNDEILLEEVTIRTPRFIDEASGEDLTEGEKEERTVEWTVRRYPVGWRLYRSVITDAHVL